MVGSHRTPAEARLIFKKIVSGVYVGKAFLTLYLNILRGMGNNEGQTICKGHQENSRKSCPLLKVTLKV